MSPYVAPGLKPKTIRNAVNQILKCYDHSIKSISAHTREVEVVKYRQCVHTLLKRNTDMSLIEIGKQIGHKDHSTVLHSIHVIEGAEMLHYEKKIPQKIVELYEEMSSQWFCLCGNEYKYKRAFE